MSSASNYRCRFIGGGTIAPLHAQYLRLSSTCSLVAIIDPFSPGQVLASELSVPHFKSVQELIASTCRVPNAYLICVPSSNHVHVAEQVLCHASPIAILEVAKHKPCEILVGHHRRFHPSLATARRFIDVGQISKLMAIAGYWTAKKDDGYSTFADWKCSRSSGGKPMWTNFVHDIDALHYIVSNNGRHQHPVIYKPVYLIYYRLPGIYIYGWTLRSIELFTIS